MTIRRKPRPEENFYVLDKSISEDARLSWAARGLLVFLLGKPDHWQVSVSHLIKQTEGAAKKSRRDAVYGLLKELEMAGYVQKEQARKDGGGFDQVGYVVSEAPLTEKPEPALTDNPEAPLTGSPDTAQPYTANPTLVSTEELARTDPSNGSNDADDPGLPFSDFWTHWPNKVSKAKAQESWAKLTPAEQQAAINDLSKRCRPSQDPQWMRWLAEQEFSLHASTYLNQKRFEDEWKPMASAGKRGGNSPMSHTNFADQDYEAGLAGFAQSMGE